MVGLGTTGMFLCEEHRNRQKVGMEEPSTRVSVLLAPQNHSGKKPGVADGLQKGIRHSDRSAVDARAWLRSWFAA